MARAAGIDDARVAGWAALTRSAKARARDGRFAVEGARAVGRLLEPGGPYPVETLLVEASAAERVAELVERAEAAGVEVVEVTREAFRKVADHRSPRGVLAIAARTEWPLERLALADDDVALVAAGIVDAGNLGTLMRCGVAFGARMLIAACGATDAFAPKTIRASAGHLLPVAHARSWGALRRAARRAGAQLVALDAGGEARLVPGEPPPREGPLLLVVGSEAGLPEEVDVDARWSIPIAAGCESLNAGVAGAIALWALSASRD